MISAPRSLLSSPLSEIEPALRLVLRTTGFISPTEPGQGLSLGGAVLLNADRCYLMDDDTNSKASVDERLELASTYHLLMGPRLSFG